MAKGGAATGSAGTEVATATATALAPVIDGARDVVGDTVTATGVRRQIRAGARSAWTRTARATFLDCLAQTCNVTRAAHSAGLTPGSAHRLRRRDAAFAEAWSAALQAGYEHVEARLLSRVLGTEAAIEPGESGYQDDAPFDAALGVTVLGQHRARAEGGFKRSGGGARYQRAPLEEVEARLRQKLAAMARRLAVEN